MAGVAIPYRWDPAERAAPGFLAGTGSFSCWKKRSSLENRARCGSVLETGHGGDGWTPQLGLPTSQGVQAWSATQQHCGTVVWSYHGVVDGEKEGRRRSKQE